MRKRKVAASVLSAAMAASMVLTGCGNDAASTTAAETKGQETKAEETKAEETEKAEETKEEKTDAETKAEEKGDSGEAGDTLPTDLGVEKIGNGEKLVIGLQTNSFIEDYDENWFTNMLEEKLGVEIEFYLLPSDANDLRSKVSLMATGGDSLPDIIMTFGGLTDVTILDYGSKGFFIPLEEYVYDEEMSPHFAAIPEEDKEIMINTMTAADGHIYGLVKYEPETWNLTPYRYYINQAWLDKLGLEVPKTTDELKEVLTAFVNNDPNGNGQKDEIGVYGIAEASGYGNNPIWALMNSFVFFPGVDTNSGLTLAEDGKTVMAPFTTDEWRQGLEYMKGLHDEGLLAASIFSDDATQMKATLNSETNVVGLVTAGSNSGQWPDCDNNANFLEMELIEPFEGPNGVKYTPYSEYTPSMDFFITSACQNPELAYRFGEAFYDFSISMDSRFGEEGVDWTIDPAVCEENSNSYVEAGIEEGINLVYNYKGEKKVWAETNSQFWHNVGPRYASLEFGNTTADGSQPFDPTKKSLMVNATNYKLYNDLHPEKVLPKLKYTAEEAEENTNPIMEITDLLSTSTAEFITGQRSLDDSGWQAYLDELNNVGLQAWLENAQAAFDRTQK